MARDEGSDESLVERVLQRDHQAFAALVRRHTGRFYATAWRMTGNAAEAEDTVQEAFLKFWSRPEMWRADRGVKFTTWFTRVVINLCLDHARRKKFSAGPEPLEFMASNAPSPDQDLYARQRDEALEAAIKTLPDKQRMALNLCFYEDISRHDAAAALGVSIKALESLLMRAKNGVRDELIRRGFLAPEEGVEHAQRSFG